VPPIVVVVVPSSDASPGPGSIIGSPVCAAGGSLGSCWANWSKLSWGSGPSLCRVNLSTVSLYCGFSGARFSKTSSIFAFWFASPPVACCAILLIMLVAFPPLLLMLLTIFCMFCFIPMIFFILMSMSSLAAPAALRLLVFRHIRSL
jgi:hypothetical protein